MMSSVLNTCVARALMDMTPTLRAGGVPAGVSGRNRQNPEEKRGWGDVRSARVRKFRANAPDFQQCRYFAGSEISTVVPPASGLSISIVPRCASTMRRAMGRPRPVPRCFVVKNGSKIFSRTSGAMPAP